MKMQIEVQELGHGDAPLMPALGAEGGVSEFEASLVHRVSSRTAGAVTQRNSVS